MRYKVRHVSTLSYASPVTRARFNLRLKPRLRDGQGIESANLGLSPSPASQDDQPGPYWVNTTRIGFDAPLKSLEVKSEFVMTLAARAIRTTGPSLTAVRNEALEEADLSDLSPAPYLFASRIASTDDQIAQWATPFLTSEDDVIASVTRLMEALHAQFTYAPGKTNSRTAPSEAFAAKHGVCQDFAHVMIIALRSHGIPAAYVSGYLLTRPPPGKPKLVGADAMHAWVDVWCGAALGWVGFDPTNNRVAGEDHIAIAMGRDYADVSPVDGTFVGSAPQRMSSAVDVERLD